MTSQRASHLSDEKFLDALTDLLAGTPEEKRGAYWTLFNDRVPPGRTDTMVQALDSQVTRLSRRGDTLMTRSGAMGQDEMSQPRRRENCHYCGSDEHVVLECAEYASDAQTVQWELLEKPFHAGLLAPNELDSYWSISKVLFRHAFNDHDCQSPSCPAMMLHNSSEMTNLLAEAFERGRAEVRGQVEAWAAKNEIAAPPLDWAGLGEILHSAAAADAAQTQDGR